MHFLSAAIRRLVLGAAALIVITSVSAAAASLRGASSVEPYVWIENPFGSGTLAAPIWHILIATIFALAFSIHYLQPRATRLRMAAATLVGLLTVLALKDTANFYRLLAGGRIGSSLPVPLSLYIAFVTAAVSLLLVQTRHPAEASRRFLGLELFGGSVGMALLVLLHLVTFGTTNYVRNADAAVVLGAKVYSDGTPSTSLEDRLSTGVELYKAGRVRCLLMTGGTGVEGCNEALAMRDYALSAGVPAHCILVDSLGVNTLASARNCRSILHDRGIGSVLLVSHYFHLARCKMLFSEQGIVCATVPAHMNQRLKYEPFYVLRECAAYTVYSVSRPWRHHCDEL